MPFLRIVAGLFIAMSAGIAAGADSYPVKPIRIVTTSPGGSNDFTSRLVAQGLAARLGQQVIVDNRNGEIPVELVSKAAPDGYTLLIHSNSVWLLPLMRNDLAYDALRDLSPISMIATAPSIVVVHPSMPTRTIKDLIALARSRPGELNYGTGVGGSPGHLAAELFKYMAGVNIVRISYRGFGQALPALVGGHLNLSFANAAAVTPYIRSNRLRALAVTSAQPSPILPEVPTVAASGLPGYQAASLAGAFAPAKTAEFIIRMLNREIVQVVAKAEVKERLFNLGAEAISGSPEEFAAAIKAEITTLGKVIQQAGIREE